MNGIPLRKAVIGVGIAGLIVAGAGLVSARTPSTFDMLSPGDNEILASTPELHSAVEMLQMYAVLDKTEFNSIVGQCVRVAKYSAQPGVGNVRLLDDAAARVKSHLRRLRERVQAQSSNNKQVLDEFDEVSSSLNDACESQSFNVHQRLSSF